MSRRHPIALAIGESAWRLIVPRPQGVQTRHIDPGDIPALTHAMREFGVERADAMLALPARMCFAARLELPDEPAGSRAWRQANTYALEEMLPITAENVSADFVASDSGVLGVCSEIEPLQNTIRLLETGGFRVASISPHDLLIAEEALRGHDPACDMVLMAETHSFSVIRINQGKVDAWHLIGDQPHDVLAHLAMLDKSPGSILLVGQARAFHETLAADGLPVTGCDRTEDDLLAAAVIRFADSGERPAIDLRRGRLAAHHHTSLARTSIVAMLAAAVLLTLSMMGACLILASRYNTRATELLDSQQALYREAIPAARDRPPDVVRTLLIYRESMSAAANETTGVPAHPSSLLVLRDLYARLPDEPSIQPSRISISGNTFEIVGVASSHGEASQLSDFLSVDRIFNVEAPKTTTQRDGGVGFTIRGTVLNRGTR